VTERKSFMTLVTKEGEPMRIIYRMRGLLGDATEEFIENLASKESDDQVQNVLNTFLALMPLPNKLECWFHCKSFQPCPKKCG